MIKVLFVCHGNICRSPMGEFVLKDLVKKAGLESKVFISSAATSREELGNSVYPPTKRVMNAHGVLCDGHVARQITKQDYDQFDYIIGMDKENLYNLLRLFDNDPEKKVHLLSEYGHFSGEVADPWYTGNFDLTWEQVLDGCEGFLKNVIEKAE